MNGSDPDDVLFNALIYTALTIVLCKTNGCHFKYFMSSYFWLNCFLTAITPVPNINRSKLTSLMFSHYSRTSSETFLILIILWTYLEHIKKKERKEKSFIYRTWITLTCLPVTTAILRWLMWWMCCNVLHSHCMWEPKVPEVQFPSWPLEASS